MQEDKDCLHWVYMLVQDSLHLILLAVVGLVAISLYSGFDEFTYGFALGALINHRHITLRLTVMRIEKKN